MLWIRTPHCHVFPFFSWFCYSYLWPLSFGMCQDSLFCPLSTFTPLMMFPNNLTLKILKICIKFMSSHSLSSEICTHKSSCLCKLSIGVANRHLEHICSRLSLWYSSPNLFHAQFSPSQWLHLHPFLLLGPKILRSSLSLSFTPHIQHTMKSYWLVKCIQSSIVFTTCTASFSEPLAWTVPVVSWNNSLIMHLLLNIYRQSRQSDPFKQKSGHTAPLLSTL